MTIRELLQQRAEFDRKYWAKKGSRSEWLQHITLHLGKAIGKLAAYLEQAGHGNLPPYESLTTEVATDAVGYALQLANLFLEDLCWRTEPGWQDATLPDHQDDYFESVTSGGFSSLLETAYEDLLYATSDLVRISNQLDASSKEDVEDRSILIWQAYENLLETACEIATYFGKNLENLYQERLVFLAGKFEQSH